ncbi:hypothetical protein Scep_004823 [Stephania cephalantha]|uniref:Uncharacterized protein n=1 Tax=Stephania cephalantha TaxID=152367 RepID=A0AAP0KW22_9MAGN
MSDCDCRKNIYERPGFLTHEIYEGYLNHWSTLEYMAKSEQASKNRRSAKNGPKPVYQNITVVRSHLLVIRRRWTKRRENL